MLFDVLNKEEKKQSENGQDEDVDSEVLLVKETKLSKPSKSIKVTQNCDDQTSIDSLGMLAHHVMETLQTSFLETANDKEAEKVVELVNKFNYAGSAMNALVDEINGLVIDSQHLIAKRHIKTKPFFTVNLIPKKEDAVMKEELNNDN
jgi:hypothetical protein